MDPATLGVLVALASPLLDLVEKQGIERLFNARPVETAALRTGEQFPEVAGLTQTLEDWCNHSSFLELLARVRSGDHNLRQPEAGLGTHLVSATRFDFGEETLAKADQVAIAFVRNLQVELLKSPEGIPILASRSEVLGAETQALVVNHAGGVST
jgi:hypothetical protein